MAARNPVKKTEQTEAVLEKMAKELLKMAEEKGLACNYLFVTTFDRYQRQIDVLKRLGKELDENEMVVSKSYVKGEKNLYSNPALVSYNRTTDSANKTAATLMRILRSFDGDESSADDDQLMSVINGDE